MGASFLFCAIWNLLPLNCARLQVANFSSNNFTGNFDDLLSGPFPLLQIVDIWKQAYWFTSWYYKPFIPRTLASGLQSVKWLVSMIFKHQPSLWYLDLSDNHLRGALPDFTGFSSLESLYLSKNEFSGSLPDLVDVHLCKYCNLVRINLENGKVIQQDCPPVLMNWTFQWILSVIQSLKHICPIFRA